jgi:hypothetical protein
VSRGPTCQDGMPHQHPRVLVSEDWVGGGMPSWQVGPLDTHGDTHRNTYRDTHKDTHRDTHSNNIELDANRRGLILRFLCLVGPG